MEADLEGKVDDYWKDPDVPDEFEARLNIAREL